MPTKLGITKSARILLLDDVDAALIEGYRFVRRRGRVKAVVGEREISVLKLLGRLTYSVVNGDWLNLTTENLAWRGMPASRTGVCGGQGRWRAYVCGKHLGYYVAEKEALEAVNAYRERLSTG